MAIPALVTGLLAVGGAAVISNLASRAVSALVPRGPTGFLPENLLPAVNGAPGPFIPSTITAADMASVGSGVLNADGCPKGWHRDASSNCCVKNKRRRKRMLTCSDKADIAFVTGTLGKGEMGRTAISSLLANCGR